MDWNLRNSNNEYLAPRVFNGGKSQLDIVNEIIEAFKTHRIVLLEGACGTGKSAIALHVLKHFNRGIITVPIINLQKQYKHDYDRNMKVHDVSVGFVMGRSNFMCPQSFGADTRPCTKKLEKGERRVEIASKCPYWSPRYPENVTSPILNSCQFTRTEYVSNANQNIIVHMSTEPCEYYEQFTDYTNKDAIILNDMMWQVETRMGRKPKVDIEIFDEYDFFFDKLSNDIILSERIFKNLQPREMPPPSDTVMTELWNKKRACMKKFFELFNTASTFTRSNIENFLVHDYSELLQSYIDKKEDVTDYSIQSKFDAITHYIEHWDKVFVDEGVIKYKIQEIRLGLAYPDIVLKNLFDENKTAKHILLMSGTCHNMVSLKELYGIDPYIVRSGAKISGSVKLVNDESINVTNKTWGHAGTQRKYYEIMHDIIVKASEKNEKILIQTPAKKYIKPIIEDKRYADKILYDGYTLKGENSVQLQNWITGTDKNILVSTRVSRGVDLKDDKCRHIIISKCPFPFYMSPHMQSLRSRFGDGPVFNLIYQDMTNRELLQQLSRASRHEKDWVKIYTPDIMASKRILGLQSKFDDFEIEHASN